jgi:hypothetical protein
MPAALGIRLTLKKVIFLARGFKKQSESRFTA